MSYTVGFAKAQIFFALLREGVRRWRTSTQAQGQLAGFAKKTIPISWPWQTAAGTSTASARPDGGIMEEYRAGGNSKKYARFSSWMAQRTRRARASRSRSTDLPAVRESS
jgi:hypothetical protein